MNKLKKYYDKNNPVKLDTKSKPYISLTEGEFFPGPGLACRPRIFKMADTHIRLTIELNTQEEIENGSFLVLKGTGGNGSRAFKDGWCKTINMEMY